MSVDTDEYIVSLGKHTDIKSVLDEIEKEDIRILLFKSKRAKPRIKFLKYELSMCYFLSCLCFMQLTYVMFHFLLCSTTAIRDNNQCKRACIDPSVTEGNTFLQVYNCDIEKLPRTNTMPAEKQVSDKILN